MIGWDWFFSCAQLQLLLVTGGLLSIYNGGVCIHSEVDSKLFGFFFFILFFGYAFNSPNC